MRSYYILSTASMRAVEVEGWDEVEKYVRDHDDEELLVFRKEQARTTDVALIRAGLALGRRAPGITPEPVD